MSTRLVLRQRDRQIEALKIQQDHLRVARDRHWSWMREASNMEIDPIRHDIINLIEKTLDQYDKLLEALRRQSNEN